MPLPAAYFQLGFHHIVSPQATDHLAFLLALTAPFAARGWRRLLALVTSFTLGHSLTLALAVLGVVAVPAALVETLVPVTVMVTAVFNLARANRLDSDAKSPVLWAPPNALALGFGLIHGLGFSNYLRALLGGAARPVAELLAFNLGVEAGQLLVVGAMLGLATVLLRGAGVARRDWLLAASSAALGAAAVLLLAA